MYKLLYNIPINDEKIPEFDKDAFMYSVSSLVSQITQDQREILKQSFAVLEENPVGTGLGIYIRYSILLNKL